MSSRGSENPLCSSQSTDFPIFCWMISGFCSREVPPRRVSISSPFGRYLVRIALIVQLLVVAINRDPIDDSPFGSSYVSHVGGTTSLILPHTESRCILSGFCVVEVSAMENIVDLISLYDLSKEKRNDNAFVSNLLKELRKTKISRPDIVLDNAKRVMKYESGNEGKCLYYASLS